MAVTVTHPFVSAISDGADATVVRPSNWNATHSISGTLDVANGGTGQAAALVAGSVVYGLSTTAMAVTAAGTSGQVLTSAGASAPTWATPTTGTVTAVSVASANGLAGTSSGGATPALTLSTSITGLLKGNGTAISAATAGTDYLTPTTGVTTFSGSSTGLTPSTATSGAITLAGTLAVANGGTNITTYAIGDLIYASTVGVLSKLADVATGNSLISGGVGVAPSYGKVGLTTHISGVLPVANGGTNASTASITSFNNITGYTASGATGTTSTNLVFSASPTFTGTLGAAAITASTTLGVTGTSTLSGNAIISVTDNTNAALRITQLGTGNALLVEDSTNPDASPFVISAGGQVVMGYTAQLSGAQYNPSFEIFGADSSESGIGQFQYGANGSAARYQFNKTRGATANAQTVVASGDELGTIQFAGSDGTGYIRGATIVAAVDGTPGTNDMPGRLVFSTTADGASSPTERMRIDSSGNVGIGVTPQSAYKMLIGGTLSDATSVALSPGATASSAVSTLFGVRTNLFTAASVFTLSSISHFYADAATVGSGSTITNQYGFNAPSNLTSATNNYGFYGNIASGTNRYNLYMAGTAANYLAGTLTAIGGISGGTF